MLNALLRLRLHNMSSCSYKFPVFRLREPVDLVKKRVE